MLPCLSEQTGPLVLVGVKVKGGKEARAHAVSPLIEAGNVYLPRALIPAPPGYAETATELFIEECAAFPNAAHAHSSGEDARSVVRQSFDLGAESPISAERAFLRDGLRDGPMTPDGPGIEGAPDLIR